MSRSKRLWLLLAAFVLAAVPARGTISASGTAAVCTAFAASTSGVVTRTAAAGNTIIVVVAIPKANATVSAVTDTGSSTYSRQIQQINGTLATLEVWTTSAGGSASSTSATITLSASTKFVGCEFEYAGVAALGVTNSASGSTANPSISLTTQDSNNWCAAGFSGQGTGAFTSLTGTLRASAVTSGAGGASNVGGAEVDNNVATPRTCTSSVTNTDTAWALGILELRSVAPVTTCPKTLMMMGVGC